MCYNIAVFIKDVDFIDGPLPQDIMPSFFIINGTMKEKKISMSEMLKKLKTMLEADISQASKIFIVGHNEPDFDSIGSAIGLQVLCKHFKKEAYIIINDADIDLEPGVKHIIDNNKSNYNIITMQEYQNLKDDNSTLIMTDVNKDYLICVKNNLSDFKNIIIIDHHDQDDHTVKTDNKYIDIKVSSASEMVAQILNSHRCRYSKDVATFLLSGIVLDTKRYIKNTSSKTHDVVEKLMNKGANVDYVNELFLVEFDEDRKINDLIFNGTIFQKYEYSVFQTHNISFTLNRNAPCTIYRRDEIAKAADKMLKYRVDAAFVLGYTKDGAVTISARSKNNIDVGKIMSHMNGGGNPVNAGTKVISNNILNIEKNLMQQVQWGFNIPEIQGEEESIPTQKIKTNNKN